LLGIALKCHSGPWDCFFMPSSFGKPNCGVAHMPRQCPINAVTGQLGNGTADVRFRDL